MNFYDQRLDRMILVKQESGDVNRFGHNKALTDQI